MSRFTVAAQAGTRNLANVSTTAEFDDKSMLLEIRRVKRLKTLKLKAFLVS